MNDKNFIMYTKHALPSSAFKVKVGQRTECYVAKHDNLSFKENLRQN